MCTCIGAGTFYVFDSRFIGKNVYIDTCAAVTARARVCLNVNVFRACNAETNLNVTRRRKKNLSYFLYIYIYA